MASGSSPDTPVGPSVETIPEGDNRLRKVCPDCGYVAYDNPKLVVGAVCLWDGRVLLCRRAIAPAVGLWTIPAGFMELGETAAQGAAREVWEEARARVTIDRLIGIYEIPRISQVQMMYAGRMIGPDFAPGEESQETALFPWDAIPWSELAFPSVRWALDRAQRGGGPWFETAPKDA